MGYTVNFCQLNYIVHWFEDYIKKRKIILFKKLKPVLQEFIEQVKDLTVEELNSDVKSVRYHYLLKEKKEKKSLEKIIVQHI